MQGLLIGLSHITYENEPQRKASLSENIAYRRGAATIRYLVRNLPMPRW